MDWPIVYAAQVDAKNLYLSGRMQTLNREGSRGMHVYRFDYGEAPTLNVRRLCFRALMETGRNRIVGCMLNRLDPGGYVDTHTDNKEDYSRYHIILGPASGEWEHIDPDGNPIEIRMEPGTLYGPLPYWMPHKVQNDSDKPRYNLLIDMV